jgi:hypothetical protein
VSTETLNGDLLLHPFPAHLDTPRSDVPSAPMRPMSFDGASLTSPPVWADSFGKDRPGVYVTFGTEMSPRAPWAALFEALSDLDVDVVATVGIQLDPVTPRPSGPNIRVEKYVPEQSSSAYQLRPISGTTPTCCLMRTSELSSNQKNATPTPFGCQSSNSSTTRACVPALRFCATTSHRCPIRPRSRRRSTNWSELRSPRPHRVRGSLTVQICQSARPEQEDRRSLGGAHEIARSAPPTTR